MKRNRAWRRRNIQRDRLAAALKAALAPTWEHFESIDKYKERAVVDGEIGAFDEFRFIESSPRL